MDDFNMNNSTPEMSGDEHTEPQEAEMTHQNAEPVREEAAQAAPAQQNAQQNAQPEMPQEAPYQPQAEEPRTPYQTPVQHPAYQAQQAPFIPYAEEPHEAPKRKKGRGRGLVIGLCSVAAACLLFAGGAAIGHSFSNTDAPAVSAGETVESGTAPTLEINSKPSDSDSYDTADGMAGEDIYKKVSPSVVSVISTTASGTGSGSGVIMSTDGYIITNNHVVEDAQSVVVQLSDGTRLDASIIGTDEQTDLAVIKVNPTTELTAAEFGDSDELEPGEYAYAIGSPGGVQFANTITGGRISAINRDVTINDRVMTLIQTDVSINNGNSGGALINKYGQVVGITSAKLSGNAFGSATVEGMGFAIPINTAKDIVDELISNGYVSGRPSIGITGSNVESSDGSIAGVQVYSIDSRAKAASEGLQVGDVITAVDGTPTPTMDDVNTVKEGKKAGDTLTLSVYRISTGKTINLTVTLTDAHDLEGTDPAAESSQSQNEQQENSGSGYGSYGNYGSQTPFSFFGW